MAQVIQKDRAVWLRPLSEKQAGVMSGLSNQTSLALHFASQNGDILTRGQHWLSSVMAAWLATGDRINYPGNIRSFYTLLFRYLLVGRLLLIHPPLNSILRLISDCVYLYVFTCVYTSMCFHVQACADLQGQKELLRQTHNTSYTQAWPGLGRSRASWKKCDSPETARF